MPYLKVEKLALDDRLIDLTDYVKAEDLVNAMHPIGDVVIRLDNVNPGSIYTGTTWQLISQGRMLMGANSSYPLGSTGGRANWELIKHNHNQNAHNHSQNPHGHGCWPNAQGKTTRMLCATDGVDIAVAGSGKPLPAGTGNYYIVYGKTAGSTATGNGISEFLDTASNTASNNPAVGTNVAAGTAENLTNTNLPPYLAVNIWVRTA